MSFLDDLPGCDIDEAFSDQEHMRASFSLFDSAFLPQEEEDEVTKEAFPVLLENVAEDGEEDDDGVEEVEEETTPPPPFPERTQAPRRRSSLLKKTLVKTFSAKEETTVLKVLKHIQSIEEKQYKHGFREINFTAGVMNCFVVAYLFGAHPEHFWICYLLESLYFIPCKFLNMIRAKPLNEALYYFDFCWMMNFNAIGALTILASPSIIPLPQDVRLFVYRGAFGIACGPLLGATLVLPFVAFVFHDVNTMTNVIIHAMPPMLLYTMRWHADDITKAWPTIFQLVDNMQDPDYFPNHGNPLFWPGTGLGSIAGNAVLIYVLWWVPYTSWMVLVGLDLPRKDLPNHKVPNYDTVFHSFWRSGSCITFGKLLWKRPVAVSQEQMAMDHYEMRDLLAYLTLHGVMVALSIPTLGYACNYSKISHMTVLVLILLAVVHRGSQRYTYYTTKMYSRIIRKEFLSHDGTT
jgi:Protein of unknown function (DUF2838)